ncbi:Transcriptional activator HlyU [Hyphomicrobium sp. 1Nfss2.1]|uniref:ArsR/SmtB family transcription factor n=1 Tax=Hyphomicrobium sp. 1Nfss2.1 TaxID=3413936 RepID=UPI003C7D7E73
MNISDLMTDSERAAAFLKALANANRLMILCELKDGERSVSALEGVVPLAQSALSQHLAKLRVEGLVKTRREAQTIYYSLADERIGRLIDTLDDLFCSSRKKKSRR